jgi:ubiquinone biosynthesis protein COQ4
MSDRPSSLPTLPENPSLLTRLRVGLQALEVLQVNPTDPAYGALFYDSVEIGLKASALDLDALEKNPPGSLGHTFARYFRDRGLMPIDTLSPPKNDAQYVAMRLRETHDFHHMVTGYDTDVLGEMELQAFTLGNLHLRTSLIILLQSAKAAQRVPDFDAARYARRLWTAFRRGSQSRQLASFRWEDHWATPLAMLREQLVAPAQQWT